MGRMSAPYPRAVRAVQPRARGKPAQAATGSSTASRAAAGSGPEVADAASGSSDEES